jgi:hypothetical protein
MSNALAYANVALELIPERCPSAGFVLNVTSPSATVSATSDKSLRNPTLKTTIDLDTVALDFSHTQAKGTTTATAAIRPNLQSFGVDLAIFSLKDGNFKISRTFSLKSFGTAALSFSSDNDKVITTLRPTLTLGPAKLAGQATLPGFALPLTYSLTLTAGIVTVKIGNAPRPPEKASIFIDKAPLSIGAVCDVPSFPPATPRFT